jgi:hypothetical protein
MFKKILKIIGVLFLILVAIVSYTSYKYHEYDKTAIPYIKDIIPIFSTWDAEKTKKYWSKTALNATTEEDYIKLFKMYRKLGTLKSIENPQSTNIFSGTKKIDGVNTIITYFVLAHYQNGDAEITLRLLPENEKYKLLSFNINSKAFIQ